MKINKSFLDYLYGEKQKLVVEHEELCKIHNFPAIESKDGNNFSIEEAEHQILKQEINIRITTIDCIIEKYLNEA